VKSSVGDELNISCGVVLHDHWRIRGTFGSRIIYRQNFLETKYTGKYLAIKERTKKFRIFEIYELSYSY